MDLQIYYSKIREIEQSLSEASVVVVSRETPDGGKDGVRTEVPRRTAAKMIVEGSARLATAEETREFQLRKAQDKRRADQRAATSRMQFAVAAPDEPQKSKGPAKPNGE
jgi:hypothetical protein